MVGQQACIKMNSAHKGGKRRCSLQACSGARTRQMQATDSEERASTFTSIAPLLTPGSPRAPSSPPLGRPSGEPQHHARLGALESSLQAVLQSRKTAAALSHPCHRQHRLQNLLRSWYLQAMYIRKNKNHKALKERDWVVATT
eukprot:scaffold224827_cov32-Tisochrysis_lutea.AAC.3